MKAKLNLLFWDPCISPHKHYFYEALCSHSSVSSVTCVIPELIPKERRSLGWSCEGFLKSKINYIIVDSIHDIEASVSLDPSVCHILSGFGPTFVQRYSVDLASKGIGLFFLYSEPRDSDGLKGLLRLIYSIFTERNIRRNILHVFAIGIKGSTWFINALYPKDRISAFGYFSKPPIVSHSTPSCSGIITIGYIGRYERSKGYHLFCEIADYFCDYGFFFLEPSLQIC